MWGDAVFVKYENALVHDIPFAVPQQVARPVRYGRRNNVKLSTLAQRIPQCEHAGLPLTSQHRDKQQLYAAIAHEVHAHFCSQMLFSNIDDGYLEGLLRGLRSGILSSTDYANLCQCESIDGARARAPARPHVCAL